MKTSIGIAALVTLLAGPLGAQSAGMAGHDMAGHDMMEQMMAPMMRGMAFAPDHLLGRQDALGLTPQQVTRLTALRDAAKTAHDAAHADAGVHMQALAQAMQVGAPDTSAVKLHFQAAHAAMGKAHWTMLAAAAQAKSLLTDEQRGRVNGWVDAMEMHQRQMAQPHQDERH